MTAKLIVDLGEDGSATVSTIAADGELPSTAVSLDMSWPLDDDLIEDLRWYLEDYLIAPFGVYEDRGARIKASLGEWGKQVFTSLFGSGPARDAYLKLRALSDMEIVFRSSSPSLLGLPWELMADPGQDRPLALETAGVSRSLQMAPDAAGTVAVPGGRLRVLMVIARPAGSGDVGYRMIARPLLERLDAVRGSVDLVVLRPPTLEALRAELDRAVAAGEPYQVVHFDGHGVMPGRRGGADGLTFAGPPAEGELVFEKPGGGADHVPSSRVAQVLADAKVPVVVLNACQSGAVGKELEAAVATRLLRTGVASVVGMAYTVYAVAAAEFMAAFYERLFAGGTVSAAVTEGRQQMFRSPGRPSPKGSLPLEDWLVPVHYLRRDVSFPQSVVSRPAELSPLAEALEAVTGTTSGTGGGDLDAVDRVFIGRDALFYGLEAAARRQKVVVLTGTGGTGKTELAKAFARWWRDTGGVERPDWVFWHSFEPGVASFGLDGVVSEIGWSLYGREFLQLDEDHRRAVVLNELKKRRMLLAWDNFESVRSMPDTGRATPPLTEEECAALREFLAEVAAGGGSSVLITSRTTEDWLGDVRRIQVGGLLAYEAAEYADVLLAPYPAAQSRRKDRSFAELMQWLDGHPLSMRLTLPLLESSGPEDLLAGLQGTAPLSDDWEQGTNRTGSLAACVAYSYDHLAPATRRLLPAISLVRSVVDAGVLEMFSREAEAPERFAGVRTDGWVDALDDATRVGLLTSLGDALYQIHPALPGYLAAVWQATDPNWRAARAAAASALLTAHAVFCEWLNSEIETGDAATAYAMIGLEHETLKGLAAYALDHGRWKDALSILAPLNDYWHTRGLDAEADAWADRARAAVEATSGALPVQDAPSGILWRFAAGHQAGRELDRHRLDRAESVYRQILSALQATEASPQQQAHLHVAYRQLSVVAERRGDLHRATEWGEHSLAMAKTRGDQADMATAYHRLGNMAYNQGDLDGAESLLLRSLAITEKVGSQLSKAMIYHQLGLVAQARDSLDVAEKWHLLALAIDMELGDRSGIAAGFQSLGSVAFRRGDLEGAEECWLPALAIEEEAGDRAHLAKVYLDQGMLALARKDPGSAEGWYRRSLAIYEELGDQFAMAAVCAQLGLLAARQGRQAEALAWVVRCVTLFGEASHSPARIGRQLLADLTNEFGMDALETAWREVTGDELPEAVRDYANDQTQEEGAGNDR